SGEWSQPIKNLIKIIKIFQNRLDFKQTISKGLFPLLKEQPLLGTELSVFQTAAAEVGLLRQPCFVFRG
ncbi:MAG: hypothetical protein IKB25_10980, partial [Lentisphaeria bacterium]|nr:hypothetical protein [Lentisphaeria bacterium]